MSARPLETNHDTLGYPVSHWQGRLLLFWMTYVVVLRFLLKFSVFAELSVFSQLEELLLVFLLPLAWRGFRVLTRHGLGKFAVACFALYLVVGVVSWLGSSVRFEAMILQLLLELKLPFVLCLFIGLGNPDFVYRRFIPILKVMILISVPLIVFELAAPRAYGTIFPASAHLGRLVVWGDLLLARASGAFRHPNELAFASALLVSLFFIRLRVGYSRADLPWLLLAAAVLLSTLQRQEIAGLLVLVVILAIATYRPQVAGERLMLSCLIALAALALLVPILPGLVKHTQFTAEQLGLMNPKASEAARVVFYFFGVQLAVQHAPLGVGFGGFGGHAASLFDSPIYRQLGFDRFLWYQRGQFMTDTFWPHVYAEAGWLGLLLYLLAFAALAYVIWHALRRARPKSLLVYSWSAAFGFFFLFSVSLTSAVLTSIYPIMLGSMFMGALVVVLADDRGRGAPQYSGGERHG